jgi:hypothetical protein
MIPAKHNSPSGLAAVFFALWMFPTFLLLPIIIVSLLFGPGVRKRGTLIVLALSLFVAGFAHIALFVILPFPSRIVVLNDNIEFSRNHQSSSAVSMNHRMDIMMITLA